ncbi:biofilm/acid-resistance regulator YmgB/AriR [Serratia sp. M24T3]|uniref:Biofilm/acid-resistance regulator YmgB/AriR n=1 Tax=Rouxiella sp. WC2420 TaxID=3234145 RepID=A0AB39VL54_9GAMM|nr:biofilm/acid-resistance regulator YmgB/AriR [Serratia sp. M24T3]EIC83442.1 hypothetical protein SPM24T3_16930 [Serratia sp. M24T3]
MAKRTTDSEFTGNLALNDVLNSNGLLCGEQRTREKRVMDSIRHIDNKFDSEREVIGAIARNIIAVQGYLTNKDIILRLISELEITRDVVQQDILRNALELVLGVTPDDSDF